jgi:hypothetical protein
MLLLANYITNLITTSLTIDKIIKNAPKYHNIQVFIFLYAK